MTQLRKALLDLSQPFYPGMSHGSVVPPPTFRTIRDVKTQAFNVTEWTFSSHVGTHMDAPMHFVVGGKTIDQIPLERLQGEAIVFDTPKGRNQPIGLSDLDGPVQAVRAGTMLFIRTGWSAKFGTEEYHQHPYLAKELADWLVERRVSTLGVDFMTPDMPFAIRPADFAYPIHRTLLPKEVLIIENLNLQPVRGHRLWVLAFPLAMRGADAGPVRVCALPLDET